ncbi:MAG: DUF4037 domain-containing protein [Spirochaetales bacterium]|nr:DUF4037 domain-containing protein [Spirochaetales bacterium]
MNKGFIKGMQLCRLFYEETVKPMLERHFPGLAWSAGRLDQGSDVLGFDTAQSMDHHWGPKTMLFLDENDASRYGQQINDIFANELPFEFHGFPTHFHEIHIDGGVLQKKNEYPIAHCVTVHTIPGFFTGYIGVDPTGPITEKDWLSMPQQALCTIARGEVFHDGLEQLNRIKKKLKWYPEEIRYYVLMCQWQRISQEEPFMARCGDVGDDLGSRIVAARMVTEIMRLAFLMERRYTPYFKWFGSAFAELSCARDLSPVLQNVLAAQNWKDRESHLSRAYEHLARMHNDMRITKYIDPHVSLFHKRPYQVIHADRFVNALYEKINSPVLCSMERKIGAIGQFTDSTDIQCWTAARKKLASVYEAAYG